MNWQRIFGLRGVGLFGLSHASARVASTVKDLTRGDALDPAAGYEEIIAGGLVMFEEDSAEEETTLKYDLTWHAGFLGEYRLGGTQKYFVTNYVTLSPLGNEGAFSVVPDINPIALLERVTGVQSRICLQSTHALARKLRLTLEGRFDRYGHFGVSHSRISPRTGLTVALSKTLSWNTSWGIYYQMPFYLFLAAFPQNRLLSPARSEHWVGGLSWSPAANVRITIEGYSKLYKDYPVSSQFPELSFANVGDTFDVRDILYPMASAGRGRANGIEFFAEKKFAGSWFGQVNLA